MYDLLIKGGRIVDGSGQPSFVGDVGIAGGKIAAVGRLGDGAAHTIDAAGLVVSPGFIDMHTHYDAQVFWDPLVSSSSWNGVTTVVMGNCGFTLAPCKPQDREYLARTLAGVESISANAISKGVPFDWTSFPQFLKSLERPKAINVAANVGHTAIRRYVLGERASDGEANQEAIDEMRAALRAALEAGAWCFTTSRSASHWGPNGEPVPSRVGTQDELWQLCMEMKGLWNCGLEMIGPQNTDGGWEFMTRVSRELSCQINWNEFNVRRGDPDGWKKTMARFEEANRQGARIYGVSRCQQTNMEYDLRENTIQMTLYPGWADILAKPLQEKKRLLAQPSVRQRLRQGIDNPRPEFPAPDWSRTAVWEVGLEKNRSLEGRTIAELAKERGQHPVDVMLDVALEEDLRTEFAQLQTSSTDYESVGKILKSPFSILGISDGGAHLNTFCGAEYTAFFLAKWVREGRVFTMEEGIRKLTSIPAAIIGFQDRGLLRAGMAADLTIFDSDKIAPRPRRKVRDLPGGEPRIIAEADGIPYMVVGGQVTFQDGKHTGVLPGRVLRSSDYR